MDDLITFGIGFLLVWTGAFFFGYPIGKIVGRWQVRREFQESIRMNFHAGTKSKEILDAEILQ